MTFINAASSTATGRAHPLVMMEKKDILSQVAIIFLIHVWECQNMKRSKSDHISKSDNNV